MDKATASPMDIDTSPFAMEEVPSPTSPASDKSIDPESPFPFEMPPKIGNRGAYEVQNCDNVRSYLKQSDTLSSAFSSRFGTKEGTLATDDSDTDAELIAFIRSTNTESAIRKFRTDAPKSYQDQLSSGATIGDLLSEAVTTFAPGFVHAHKEGMCILIAAFLKCASQKFKPTDPEPAIRVSIETLANEFDSEKALSSLRKRSLREGSQDGVRFTLHGPTQRQRTLCNGAYWQYGQMADVV
jgi:hypothetical protein